MRASHTKSDWDAYVQDELSQVLPYIDSLGFKLDTTQVHIGGERHLMSGKKLVLTGTNKEDGHQVIIKVSSDQSGISEIESEHRAREILKSLPFAERPFLFPREEVYGQFGPYRISITAFEDQRQAYIAHSLEEQFFLALRAFAVQEGLQAATYEHTRMIREAFGIATPEIYLAEFGEFMKAARTLGEEYSEVKNVFEQATLFLADNYKHIARYTGFLTHTDFVPHNFRINDKGILLLDLPALRFGNKYESWARFLNYMTVHNPTLERMLDTYIKENRATEEYMALRLMRTFKLGELLSYYIGTLDNTEGDLHTLNRERIFFWSEVLRAVLEDTPVSEEIVDAYVSRRNELRSEEELKRQEAIQQVL